MTQNINSNDAKQGSVVMCEYATNCWPSMWMAIQLDVLALGKLWPAPEMLAGDRCKVPQGIDYRFRTTW